MEHEIDIFEATYMRQSIYDILQNGIRNRPELKEQIEKTFEDKIILPDNEYHARYSSIIANMIKPVENFQK